MVFVPVATMTTLVPLVNILEGKVSHDEANIADFEP